MRTQNTQYVVDLWRDEYESHASSLAQASRSTTKKNIDLKSFRVKNTRALDAFLATLQLQDNTMHQAFLKDKAFCTIMAKADATEWMANVINSDRECLEWGLEMGWGKYWTIASRRMRGAEMLFEGREAAWQKRAANWRGLSPHLQDAWLERYVPKVTTLIDYIKSPSDAAIRTVFHKGSFLSAEALCNVFQSRPDLAALSMQLLNIDTNAKMDRPTIVALNHLVQSHIHGLTPEHTVDLTNVLNSESM